MNIERAIAFYDNQTELHINSIPIKIDLDILTQLFQPAENDPLLYDCYEITKEISSLLKKHIDFDFDFNRFSYYLETYSTE